MKFSEKMRLTLILKDIKNKESNLTPENIFLHIWNSHRTGVQVDHLLRNSKSLEMLNLS